MTKSELETLIRKHNDLYWNGTPEISDTEYDSLVRQLQDIDPENELVVRFAVPDMSEADTVIHKKPMLSLDKVYSKEELLKWVNKTARGSKEVFKIQPKYDGLSGKLEDGILASRGDGKTGQNYTSRMKLIKIDSNRKINPDTDYMLGEIVISNNDFNTVFKTLKSKSGQLFKNQRNGVAGIIGNDDPDFYYRQVNQPLLTFVDYDKNSWCVTAKELPDKWEEIMTVIQKTEYPMDGIVIKLYDQEYADSLGCTEHHPRSAVAFKYTNQSKLTKLIDVEWSMGKEQINAVGVVEPVDISGTTIRRVRLQLTAPKNTDVETYLINGSLRIGDTVEIERAGDIIPHVVKSIPGDERKRVMIDRCPFCGGNIIVEDTSVKCANQECPEKAVQRLYFSMVTLGFKGIGEAYARDLYNLLNVRTVYDLLNVTREELARYSEFGDKLADNFITEQKKARTVSVEQFLTSLNIPSLGNFASRTLTKNFSIEKILSGELTEQDLLSISGFGPVAAKEISTGLREFKDIVMKSFQSGNWSMPVRKQDGSKTICFTGKMSQPRKKMEELAESIGFSPVDHFVSGLDVLVCADPNSGSGKLQKARKAGTRIISEEEFMSMLTE